MTKILLLTNSTNGLYSFRKELIEEFIHLKYEISICSPFSKQSDYFQKLGCHMIDIAMSSRGTNPIKDLALLRNYVKILKAIKPNVVLTYTVKPNVYGGIACRILKIPYLTNITGLGDAVEQKGILSRIVLSLYRIGIQKASCVFFQNRSNQTVFKEKGLVNGKCRLLPGSGVNLQDHVFEEYPKDNGELHFLFVGRLLKTKGIEELLTIIPTVKSQYPKTFFSLIGEIPDVYQERLSKMERAGLLTTYGYCSQVHDFMKKCHAILLPSYHEGTANVLLEGAATGRPVLASKVPGCMETYNEGITGIGFEARNIEDLGRAIEEFIQLPYAEKAEMGKRAREKMEQEYNRKIVIDAYIQEIKIICQ